MKHVHIDVTRKAFKETYTIGEMYIDGEYFCDTLEDKVRVLRTIKDKVPGETAIPEGTYEVALGMSPRFKRVLPRLHDVPFFDGILIHRGNTAEDTHGCILVGDNRAKGKVLDSAKTETALMDILKKADSIDITIKNEI